MPFRYARTVRSDIPSGVTLLSAWLLSADDRPPIPRGLRDWRFVFNVLELISPQLLHAREHNAKDDTGNADRPGDEEEDAVSSHQRVAVLRQIVDQGA